jgi:hypothetical protein
MSPLDGLTLRVGPFLAGALIRVLRLLIRWTYQGDEVARRAHRQGRPYVHAIFHDQLLMMNYSYLGREYGRRLVVLSSRHRDGEYLSRTLERFGHVMVRGSTGRGAVGGLKEMVRHLRAGHDAAFATDGPRGPRHKVQIGVIEAARLGRAPIVPVVCAASKKKPCDPGMPSRSPFRSRAASSSTVSRFSSPPTPIGTSWN